MSNVFLGQIVMFGGNFAPRNFALCNGQLMSIAQFSALFSLLGPGSSAQGWANPNTLRKSYENMMADLGQGNYDKLFVSAARTGDVYPEFGGIANRGRSPGASQQQFGRHAAHVQAIATHQFPFDQRHARTESRRSSGSHQSRCSGSDDNQMVRPRW